MVNQKSKEKWVKDYHQNYANRIDIKGFLVDCYNDLCQEEFPKERWFQAEA